MNGQTRTGTRASTAGTWLVLLALLFNGLASTLIPQVLTGQADTVWLQVCSADGIRTILQDGGDDTETPAGTTAGTVCPLYLSLSLPGLPAPIAATSIAPRFRSDLSRPVPPISTEVRTGFDVTHSFLSRAPPVRA